MKLADYPSAPAINTTLIVTIMNEVEEDSDSCSTDCEVATAEA